MSSSWVSIFYHFTIVITNNVNSISDLDIFGDVHHWGGSLL